MSLPAPSVHSRVEKQETTIRVQLTSDPDVKEFFRQLIQAIQPRSKGNGQLTLNVGQFSVSSIEWREKG